ncbi:MAG: glycerol-3-phosphate dehydrogenase/oxidase [Acidimicrobiia bacterium]|nr:glycerol-3-phosphate dehydrogenase/oxidase [Acidimicrobiia bacterium]
MTPDRSALGPAQRARDVERLANEQFDLLVIGGGVTGTGIALDAAVRGLNVALVEQRDYSSGTSSRSSKLFHGGLRYLEQLNFRLVREALRERNLMLKTICPHLAEGIPFLYPLKHRIWERVYVGAGIALYDFLATISRSPLPHHRHMTKTGALEAMPALDPGVLVGAIQYWDALVDDARHTMMVARTAAAHGAALVPSAKVVGLTTDSGRVTGAEVADLEAGSPITVRARQTVNATGVWTDDVEDLVKQGPINVTASKGIHMVIPKDRISSSTGVITRTKTSVLFIIPWGEFWLIGTTDTDWNLDLAHPAASRSDLDYLLANANAVLEDDLSHEDVVGVYAGLRPLLTGETDATSKLSREHAVAGTAPGMISIAGGKYTTYRVMAKDAVDVAIEEASLDAPASTTESVPLVGAAGYQQLLDQADQIVAESGLDRDRVVRMLRRYGDRISEVLALVGANAALGEPLPGAERHIGAEIVYAASHEGALHLDDVLTRRTRISIETPHRGVEVAEQVAHIMGGVLGWSDAVISREVEHYLARVNAELDSQRQPDDRTADAARLGAPDVRGFSG